MSATAPNSSENFLERNKIKIAAGALLVGCYAVVRKRYTSVFRGSIFETGPDLTGKTVVISEPHFRQAYSGTYTALNMAAYGAKVYVLVPRPISDSEGVLEQLREKSGNKDIHLCGVDMTSLRSIRKFAVEFGQKNDTVDLLINNADQYRPAAVHTEEGYPRRFTINYLGRVLLTHYLLENLNNSPDGKILNVSYMCRPRTSKVVKEANKHRGDMQFLIRNPESFYTGDELEMYSYQICNANRKYVAEMAKQLKDTNITINQVEIELQRSAVMTIKYWTSSIYQNLLYFYRHTHRSAANLITYAALSEDFQGKSGVVINGHPKVEEINFPDSEVFFQHTLEVLKNFEKEFPFKPAPAEELEETDTVEREPELLET